MSQIKQKQITDTPTTQRKLPEKIKLTEPTPQKQKLETKPIPQEILILTRGMEEIEGIIYAMRQQILQLYGPVDYTNISDIELTFTEQQAKQLSFELQGNYWIIHPKQFLGSDTFADIASTVRRIGGEYVSATKDSHAYFKVPLKKA